MHIEEVFEDLTRRGIINENLEIKSDSRVYNVQGKRDGIHYNPHYSSFTYSTAVFILLHEVGHMVAKQFSSIFKFVIGLILICLYICSFLIYIPHSILLFGIITLLVVGVWVILLIPISLLFKKYLYEDEFRADEYAILKITQCVPEITIAPDEIIKRSLEELKNIGKSMPKSNKLKGLFIKVFDPHPDDEIRINHIQRAFGCKRY